MENTHEFYRDAGFKQAKIALIVAVLFNLVLAAQLFLDMGKLGADKIQNILPLIIGAPVLLLLFILAFLLKLREISNSSPYLTLSQAELNYHYLNRVISWDEVEDYKLSNRNFTLKLKSGESIVVSLWDLHENPVKSIKIIGEMIPHRLQKYSVSVPKYSLGPVKIAQKYEVNGEELDELLNKSKPTD